MLYNIPPYAIPRTSAARHHYALAEFAWILLPPLVPPNAQIPLSKWAETSTAPSTTLTVTVSTASHAYTAHIPSVVDNVPVSDNIPAAVWAETALAPTIEYLTEQTVDIPVSTWADLLTAPSVVDNEPVSDNIPAAAWANLANVPTILDNEPVSNLVPVTAWADLTHIPTTPWGQIVPLASWAEAALVPTEVIYPPNFYDVTATLPNLTMDAELSLLTEWTLPSLSFQANMVTGIQGVCRLNKWLPCSAVCGSHADDLTLPAITGSCVFSSDQDLTVAADIPCITVTSRTAAIVSTDMPLNLSCDGILNPGRLMTVSETLPAVKMTGRLSREQEITMDVDLPGLGMEARTGSIMSVETPAFTMDANILLYNFTEVDANLPVVTCHAQVSFGNMIRMSGIIPGEVQVSSHLISHQDGITVDMVLPAPVMLSRMSRLHTGVLRYQEDREDADTLSTAAGYDGSTGVLEYSR